MPERKSVAIVGFAPNTLSFLEASKADEVWSVVWSYRYEKIGRIDRLFEMHAEIELAGRDPRPAFAKTRDHYKYLQHNTSTPVYMQRVFDKIPQSVEYPREAIDYDIFKYDTRGRPDKDPVNAEGSLWVRDGKPQRIYTSSVDFMLALAIHEGFEVIEIYGIELSSGSEYQYQQIGFAVWAGIAIGRGIRLEQQKSTQLLYRPMRYGYDGYQMISRQTLEKFHQERIEQVKIANARVQHAEGKLFAASKALAENKKRTEEAKALREKWRIIHKNMSPSLRKTVFKRKLDRLHQIIQGLELTALDEMVEKFRIEMMREREMLLMYEAGLQDVTWLLTFIDLDERRMDLFNPFYTHELEEESSEPAEKEIVALANASFVNWKPSKGLLSGKKGNEDKL